MQPLYTTTMANNQTKNCRAIARQFFYIAFAYLNQGNANTIYVSISGIMAHPPQVPCM